MSDRELLEAAAKAAGIDHMGWVPAGLSMVLGVPWNPLTSDADALRLAVKLEMFMLRIVIEIPFAEYDDDPYAATRRAIVRAAAEIAGHHSL
jgi:hypothetical protein